MITLAMSLPLLESGFGSLILCLNSKAPFGNVSCTAFLLRTSLKREVLSGKFNAMIVENQFFMY